jgi:hypothetical protein
MNMQVLIGKRKALEKARHEYHGFMSVRSIKNINANYKLLDQALLLENKLVKASNEVTAMINSIEEGNENGKRGTHRQTKKSTG